jgi:HEAT repeat protein
VIHPFADVRTLERPRFRFFFLLSALLGAAQVVGVAVSEALFLAAFGVAWLPHTFVAAAVFTVAASYLYATVVGRTRNDRLFEQMLTLSAALLFVMTAGIVAGAGWLVPLLICIYWANYAVFLNHYWTFTGDYFDTLASKRLFPIFTVGASLGSIAGGLLTAVLGRFAPPETIVAAWGAFLLAAAYLLRRNRRRLRRWGPLELEEADDTSVQGIRGALLLVRTTPIGRRLALSALAMVLSLFMLQYLYSDVFARSFETAEALAFFFGAYLVVTNVLEVAVEIWITPWLIRRFGVASTNVVHPVLTVLSFGVLAFDYRLGPAVVARANREMIENAMAGPVRNLVYNALPGAVRGPTRAFLEGIVVYSGMAVAGTLLIVLSGRLDPRWLCAAGAGVALLYLAANLGVRRQYLRTLVDELRDGRIDLDSLSGELGRWEVARLAELWHQMLAAHDDRAASLAGQLAPQLAARGAVAALRAGLDHDDPSVRQACVAALGGTSEAASEDALLVALEDEDGIVRHAAVEALPEPATTRSQEAALRRRLRDTDPRVRASAAARLGAEGVAALTAMLDEPDVATVCAALGRLPADALEKTLGRIDDADPEIQAAALEAVVLRLDPMPLGPERLSRFVEHENAHVRLAAVRCLARRPEPEVAELLARRLADPAHEVRRDAAALLGNRGREGFAAAEPQLRSDATHGIESAIVALDASSLPEATRRLDEELAFRVRQAWQALLCLQVLPVSAETIADRFLRLALADALARDWRLAFYLLDHTEDRTVMRSVEKALRFSTARSRGNALEVLSNLGDRETAHLMVLLAEPGPVTDKLGSLRESVEVPEDAAEATELARRSSNRWIHASFALAEADGVERAVLEELMEKLLALKRVPLFAHFSLEQLEGITRVTRERVYRRGETVLEEGAIGGDLFVVIAGRVRVLKNRGKADVLDLGTMGDGSYFGEMAIFDDKPRSATIVAEEDTRVLILAGDRLKDFVMQTPEMSFQIFEVLTTRIREVEARLEQSLREG